MQTLSGRLFITLFIAFTSTLLHAAGTDPTTLAPATSVPTIEASEASALLTRLDEIREMDKSSLTKSDKKELRKEIRTIKASLKDISGGVYLSAGTIILLVVLLLLL